VKCLHIFIGKSFTFDVHLPWDASSKCFYSG
jgi:hypothetical protein